MQQATEDCKLIKPADRHSVAERIMLVTTLMVLISLCNTETAFSQGENAPKPPANNNDAPPLPPGTDLPPKIPAIMTMTKEMITPQELKALKKPKTRADKYILRGDTSPQSKAAIKKWVDFYILPMTLEENRKKLGQMRNTLLQGIKKGAKKILDNKSRSEAFRTFLLQTVADRCETLFDNNFHVRLHAVLILNELRLFEATSGGDAAVPFVPAYFSLLKVIKDDKQHEAIKIVATKGIKNILMNGKPSGNNKQEIAKTLISQLGKEGNSQWYNMRLIQVLARVKTVKWLGKDGRTHPFIMDTILNVLKDPKRGWQVRSEAARGLGLILLDKGNKDMKPKMLATEIVKFCNEMTVPYEKDPKGVFWKNNFFKVYLAFAPQSLDRQIKKEGLNSKGSDADVKKAYDLVLPIVRHVLHQPMKDNKFDPEEGEYLPIPQQDIQNLTAWLKRSTGKAGGNPTTAIPANNPDIATASRAEVASGNK